MSEIAISVEGLSKIFHIGGLQKSHYRLTDQLADIFVAPFRRAGNLLRGQAASAAELDETIWALKDINFEAMPGEAVRGWPVCPRLARVITASVITPKAPAVSAWMPAGEGMMAGANAARPSSTKPSASHK